MCSVRASPVECFLPIAESALLVRQSEKPCADVSQNILNGVHVCFDTKGRVSADP